MLTSEQRFHLNAQAEYWYDEQHHTYTDAIRAALATIEEQEHTIDVCNEAIRQQEAELALLRRVAGPLDMTCGDEFQHDCCVALREWRARFGAKEE